MQEHKRYSLTITAAETIYNLWELASQHQELELDKMMRRLKDLSAYSLTRAEILNQRQGVELLALAMFFGAVSDCQFHINQKRFELLSEETLTYPGRAEVIEQEVTRRETHARQEKESNVSRPPCFFDIDTPMILMKV